MTADIQDDDLDFLMAELEAQNADIAAKAPEPEKTIEAAPQVETKVEPQVDPELAALEALEDEVKQPNETTVEAIKSEPEPETFADAQALIDALDPTPADELNADQEVGLKSVIEPATQVELDTEMPDSTPDKGDNVEAEPIPETVVEQLPETKSAPIDPVKAEPRELKIAPQPVPEGTKLMSPETAKEVATLKYKPDVNAFQRDTKITDATLDQCFLDQASLMAYYTAQHAHAEAQLARTKQKFNTLEAGLYDAYRRRFLDEGEKVTEKAIENAVRMDKKWVAASNLLIEAQTYADIHKGFVQSLRDRRDMLIQRGADRREEMKGQLRTLDRVDPESPANQASRRDHEDLTSKAISLASAAMQRNS